MSVSKTTKRPKHDNKNRLRSLMSEGGEQNRLRSPMYEGGEQNRLRSPMPQGGEP